MVTRTKSGCVFFLFLKNTKYIRQEKQNTKKTVKNPFFSDRTNFVKAAKFYRNDISKQKKNTHPDLTEVLVKKISTRPVQPFPRKSGKTFFSAQKPVLRKTKNKKKISYSVIECT